MNGPYELVQATKRLRDAYKTANTNGDDLQCISDLLREIEMTECGNCLNLIAVNDHRAILDDIFVSGDIYCCQACKDSADELDQRTNSYSRKLARAGSDDVVKAGQILGPSDF